LEENKTARQENAAIRRTAGQGWAGTPQIALH